MKVCKCNIESWFFGVFHPVKVVKSLRGFDDFEIRLETPQIIFELPNFISNDFYNLKQSKFLSR